MTTDRISIAYCDLENIVFSSRGGGFDFGGLTAEIKAQGYDEIVAVATDSRDMEAFGDPLRALGWHVYLAPEKRGGNADAALSLLAGAFSAKRPPGRVLLITSDGRLITDFAWALRIVVPEVRIAIWYQRRQAPTDWLPTDNPMIAEAATIDGYFAGPERR
jgi:hypothetical protein